MLMTELLDEIRPKVPMFVGTHSLTKLADFIRGYSFACYEQWPEYEREFLSEFQRWVEKRFDVKISQSWANIILFQTLSESSALDLFWKLLDEFKLQHPKS